MLKIEDVNLFKVKKATKEKIIFTYEDKNYLISEENNILSLVKRVPINSTGQFNIEPIKTIKGNIPTLHYHTRKGNCYNQIDLEKLIYDLTFIGLIGGCFENKANETLRKQQRLEKAILKQETLLAQEQETLKELQKSIEKRKSAILRKKEQLEKILK